MIKQIQVVVPPGLFGMAEFANEMGIVTARLAPCPENNFATHLAHCSWEDWQAMYELYMDHIVDAVFTPLQ